MVCVYVMSVCVYFKLPIEVKGQFFKKDFIFMSGGGGGGAYAWRNPEENVRPSRGWS